MRRKGGEMAEWTWSVVLADGTMITAPQPGGFNALPLDDVRQLVVHDGSGNPDHTHVVHVPPDATPVFFVRWSNVLNPNTNQTVATHIMRACCFGWEHRGGAADGVKSLTWVLGDGSQLHTHGDVNDLGILLPLPMHVTTGETHGE